MRQKLTARFVETVKAPIAGRLEISDTDIRGLTLRVAQGKAPGETVKTWSVRYRPKGRAQRRETIGTFPAVKLTDARRRAGDITAAAMRGVDLVAQEAEERRKAEAAGRTIGAVVEEYLERHCRPNQRRAEATERLFNMHVLPRFRSKPLAELRRADVIEFLNDLREKKRLTTQVNRVHAQLKAALNWAVEMEYTDANPAAAVKRQYKGERPRDRVLSDAELRALWRATDGLSDPSRALARAWMLTGQRRDEVRCMAWAEVDLESALWTIPAERTKARRQHEVPLSPQMVGLIADLPRRGAFVFSVTKGKPYAGQRRLKDILAKESGVADWCIHDIRRTVASGLAALHVSQDVIARVLNHADRSITAVYNRHQYLEEKRAALTAWAARVTVLVGEGHAAPNVVAIR